MWDIPHCESTPAFFDMNIGPSGQILTIFEIHIAKMLVSTIGKIFFKVRKTCELEGTLDKHKIKDSDESRCILSAHPV